jgi:phosphatidylglycerophosphate synthase
MKKLADLLTASRALIAILIVALSLEGKKALPWVILLIIVGWTTDILDGRLARRARGEGSSQTGVDENTWLGEHDFLLDMILVFSSLIYLTAAGFIGVPFALGYTLVAAIFILWASGSKSVTELFAFPLTALPLIIAYQEVPWAAYMYLIWILLALVFCWERFVGVVREFIAGMRWLRKI